MYMSMSNSAPEKIYISPNSEESTYYVSNQYNRLIEYTCTDAFIEKARKWFEKQTCYVDIEGDYHWDENWFDDFLKAMKL